MQQSKIVEEFYLILHAISSLTKEIAEIISKPNFNENIDLVTIEDKYAKRKQKINQLNNILSSPSGVNLINNNPKWEEFVLEVDTIERKNISFFEKKSNNAKIKLADIDKKKNLLIYNE